MFGGQAPHSLRGCSKLRHGSASCCAIPARPEYEAARSSCGALDKLKAPLRQLALRRMLHATSISWNSSATNGFTTSQSTARASTPSNLRGNLCSI